jgi:glycosyltransferase involved in cell wall biosynthesis
MPAIPEISVLLPVHNAAAFLRPALESLAIQSGVAFEVIAVDDGSTDDSLPILEAAAKIHSWLRVVAQSRAGFACALNRAVMEARGDLIARMDADDIAMPGRLEQQARYLRSSPAIGMCGSWFRIFGSVRESVVKVPLDDQAIRARLVFGAAFGHPTVMFRRGLLKSVPGPYEDAEGAEDYRLWLRLATRTKFHNLPEVLLRYRRHSGQLTGTADTKRGAYVANLRNEILTERGLIMTTVERRAHAALGFEAIAQRAPSMFEVQVWLERLSNELPRAGWCEPAALKRECAEAWWRFVQQHASGWQAARCFWRAPFVSRSMLSAIRTLRLALRH